MGQGVWVAQPATRQGREKEKTVVSFGSGEKGEAGQGKEETEEEEGLWVEAEGETDPAQSSKWLPAACL